MFRGSWKKVGIHLYTLGYLQRTMIKNAQNNSETWHRGKQSQRRQKADKTTHSKTSKTRNNQRKNETGRINRHRHTKETEGVSVCVIKSTS